MARIVLFRPLLVLSLLVFCAVPARAKPLAVLRIPSLSQWESANPRSLALKADWLDTLRQRLGPEYQKINKAEPLWILWCLKPDGSYSPDLVFLVPSVPFENPSLVFKPFRNVTAIASDAETLSEAESFYTEARQKQAFPPNTAWAELDIPAVWSRYRATAQMMRGLFSMTVSDIPVLRKQCHQSFEFLFWLLDSLSALHLSMPLDPNPAAFSLFLDIEFQPDSIFMSLFPKVTQTTPEQASSKNILGRVRMALDPRPWKQFLLQYADRLQQNNFANPGEAKELKLSIHRILDAFPQKLLIFDSMTRQSASSAFLQGQLCFEAPGQTIILAEVKTLFEALFLKHPYQCCTTSDSKPPYGQVLTVALKPRPEDPSGNEIPLLLLQWAKILFTGNPELTLQFFEKDGRVYGTLGTLDDQALKMNAETAPQENEAPFFELRVLPSILTQIGMPSFSPHADRKEETPFAVRIFKKESGLHLETQVPKSIFEALFKKDA